MPGTVQVTYKTDYQDTQMGAVTKLNAYNAEFRNGISEILTKISLTWIKVQLNYYKKFLLGIVGVIPGMAGVKRGLR